MKLIHTSDWHFGIGHGVQSYALDQKDFLDQLYGLIQREKVEAVLIAGDIFDSSVTNSEAIALYNEAMTKLCAELGITVVIIAGNHDSAARLASCRELLKAAGLHITGRLEKDPQPLLLDGGKVAVYSLPFFGREEVTALYRTDKESTRTQERATAFVCEQIRGSMDPQRFNIVLSHSMIVDAEVSESDRAAKIGGAAAVSKDVFEGFDYVALGHIHKHQILSDTVRYSGSPLKYSFGKEETQEKGVILLDTDTREQTFVPIVPLRDHRTVEGTFEEIDAMDPSEDYLRLKITDRFAGMELMSDLLVKFPNLMELKGMELTEGEGASSLSAGELESLDETDIMTKFLGEIFGAVPDEDQLELFREALELCQKEDDLG